MPTRSASPIARRDYSSSLHRRFLVSAGIGGVVTIALLSAGAWYALQRTVAQSGDETLREAAHRSALVLASAIEERTRETEMLAYTPQVIAAAKEGAVTARRLGIVGQDIKAVEAKFAGDHSMNVAPESRQVIRTLLPHLYASDLLLTDIYGYNAIVSDHSTDFVQSDEAWWQEAWKNGHTFTGAIYDTVTHTPVIALAHVLTDGPTRVGVMRIKFDITPVVASLTSAGAGVRVDIVDTAGHIVMSTQGGEMGTKLASLPPLDSLRGSPYRVGDVAERALMRPADGDRWRIVVRLSDTAIAAPYQSAKLGILGGTGALLLVLGGLLFAMHRFLTRRITQPVADLAWAAEAVAAGDFSVQVRHVATDDEIGRTARAVAAMVLELRRLAQAIAASTRQTNVMSSEITAGSEEMAATAGEIASTASDLSSQATHMAETIGSLATSATALRGLAAELEAGANEGVARNTALRTLATENRAGLDASSESLGTLANDVHASASAIEALAAASAEIRQFVTLVRKLARQSKLLALNAAMEAARAGEQGEGFAVVASEVRRLASMSSDAAERTEAVVNGVLNGIEESRASTSRAVTMADAVRSSNSRASASFAEIERAVAEADAWTASVQTTSTSTRALVTEMNERLGELSGGTESFAAAMEQVAASSQEQSAATEEIAGAANGLVSAAERLNQLVSGLKLGEELAAPAEPAAAPAAVATQSPIAPLTLAVA